MAALYISLTFQVFLLVVVSISRHVGVTEEGKEDDLVSWETVCSELCDTPTPTTDVYLTNGQKKHLEECQDLILALEETPEMLEVYSDLRDIEMVQFTGSQRKQLITGYKGYYHQRYDLPNIDTSHDLPPPELPTYDNETLQNVQEEFLEKWNAYTQLQKSLQDIDVHLDDSESSEEEKETSSEEILSRKKRLGKSYRPSKNLRELMRKKVSLGLDLSLKSNNVFNPKLYSSKREGLPKIEINDSVLPEEDFSSSFKQRFMRRYQEAIEKSLNKIRRTGTRVGGNSIRQKRQIKEETVQELCPTDKVWTAMVLAYDDSGNLVQITQFPQEGQQQWFQEEKCLYLFSPVQGNVECKVRYREVPAMVVDLNIPDAPVQESYIKVESCAAYLTTDDTPPESGTTAEPPQELTTTA